MWEEIVGERLNAVLFDDLAASEQFISMVYLQILPGAIKYTTAGHYPPLILRKNSFINHSTEDVLLGVERYAEYHEKRMDIEKGDVVVLYTHCIIDLLNLEKFKKLFKGYRNNPAQKIMDSILKEIKRSAGSKPIRDDVTMVVLKSV